MDRKLQSLAAAAACLFFVVVSLAGLAAVFVSGELTGVDGLLLLMLCGGMALLFAWLTFSALQAAGMFGGGAARAPEAAPASSAPAKAEGK